MIPFIMPMSNMLLFRHRNRNVGHSESPTTTPIESKRTDPIEIVAGILICIVIGFLSLVAVFAPVEEVQIAAGLGAFFCTICFYHFLKDLKN